MRKILVSLLVVFSVFSVQAQSFKSDTVDVIHYDLDLDIIHLSNKTISGKATLTLVSVLPNISSFSLDLLELVVDSVHSAGLLCNHAYDDTTLTIFLPQNMVLGDTATINIWYHGQPVVEAYGWGGFHFSSDSSLAYNLGIAFYDYPHNYGRVWFPCIDEFQERASYDYHITVKDPFDAVCSGYLVGVQNHSNNTSTYHWRLDQSIPAYLASVAISDYANAAIPINTMLGPISADILVNHQDSADALASLQNLQAMVQVFENRFGPYRWPRIGFTGTTLGAMEHACNIAMPSYQFNGTTSAEWLFAHELSHQWFGNLVTCASPADMWLNEGWAAFSETIIFEGLYGIQARKDYVRSNHENVLQFAHTPQGDDSYLAVYGIPDQYTYGTTVYDKGSSVVHSLRGFLGDSLFFSAVQAYLNQYAFNHATTQNLRDFLSAYTGINMNPWFDAWVMNPGFIDFRVDSFHTITGPLPETQVTVYVSQHLKGPAQYCSSNRMELLFMDESWNVHHDWISFSGVSDSASFWVPFKPTMILLDPEERIMDATTDNYQVIDQLGTLDFPNTKCILNVLQVQDSAFVRITHHWVAPEQFQSPIPGLTLSTKRYWSVEGIFPTGFSAQGRFLYSKSNYLDDDILLNPNDSLIILYRPGPGYEWSPVSFVKSGAAFTGRIIVLDLKPGDYTLAVWDESHLGLTETWQNDVQALQIYPNPSNDTFNILVPQQGFLSIFNMEGEMIQRTWVESGQRYNWSAHDRMPGTYISIIVDPKGQLFAQGKMLVVK